MRASIAAEKAGFPSASIATTAFLKQAKVIAKSLGIPELGIAEYPGVIMTQSDTEFEKNVEILCDNIITALNRPSNQIAEQPVEPKPKDIIFQGTLDDLNRFFVLNHWTDGLPIIPPTIERISKFLMFTERDHQEVLGILLPENREATIWNIAVNGVMAGCRPEYMPILIAIVEAISDPNFRIQDAGSTPGWEPLIILNGPIIKELGFNYETGVMRVGNQANTSIGRFLRLYMRNVAGLRILPQSTDKGCIAYTFNVVLAENEDAIAKLGWEPFCADQGFEPGENIVTVQSAVYTTAPIYTGSSNVLDHMQLLNEIFGRSCSYWTYVPVNIGKFFPLLVMSPCIAEVFAKSGWKKGDIRKYLYENSKVEAGFVERMAHLGGITGVDLFKFTRQGILPKEFGQSEDPRRLVPAFLKADQIGIVISGDPGRNQSKGYIQNHEQGPPTSKKIILPTRWHELLNKSK